MQSNRGPWPEAFDRYFKARGPRSESIKPKRIKRSPSSAGKSGGTLSPHQGAIDTGMAQHLLRRVGFGASVDGINARAGTSVDQVVNDLIQEAIHQPMPDPPHWENAFLPPDGSSDSVFEAYFDNNIDWGLEYVQDWILKLYSGGLRERMTLLWHDHFVTEIDVYFFAPMAYRYLTTLRTHALGNFKQMVYEIGLDPAMLVYLNGDSNYWWEPNENYARELLELFTMGQYDKDGALNYTQDDIVQLALALTGWEVDYYSYTSVFNFSHYYNRNKTIFGINGVFDYEKVIDHIFEQRGNQIAHFICSKMYAEFVYDAPDETVVDELAGIFLANNFEIAPVVEALLKSDHFYAPEFRGAKLKSPVDMMVGMMHETGIEQFAEQAHEEIFWLTSDLGQQLLQPPNVAGWPGYRDWITTSTLPNRWDLTEYMSDSVLTGRYLSLVSLSKKLLDVNDPLLVFKLPVALAEHFIAVSPDELGFESPSTGFGGDLNTYPIPQEILDSPQHVQDLAKIFLQGEPWYEWHLGQAGIIFFLLDYFRFLTELPEYQLI